MKKLDITRILSHTKYSFPVRPTDKAIHLVDIDKAADQNQRIGSFLLWNALPGGIIRSNGRVVKEMLKKPYL
jgi:hypothetical protein